MHPTLPVRHSLAAPGSEQRLRGRPRPCSFDFHQFHGQRLCQLSRMPRSPTTTKTPRRLPPCWREQQTLSDAESEQRESVRLSAPQLHSMTQMVAPGAIARTPRGQRRLLKSPTVQKNELRYMSGYATQPMKIKHHVHTKSIHTATCRLTFRHGKARSAQLPFEC